MDDAGNLSELVGGTSGYTQAELEKAAAALQDGRDRLAARWSELGAREAVLQRCRRLLQLRLRVAAGAADQLRQVAGVVHHHVDWVRDQHRVALDRLTCVRRKRLQRDIFRNGAEFQSSATKSLPLADDAQHLDLLGHMALLKWFLFAQEPRPHRG